jgi:hypothetical protein
MTKLLLDRLADFADAWALLLRKSKELLPGLMWIGTRFGAEYFSYLTMHLVNQFLGGLSDLVQER